MFNYELSDSEAHDAEKFWDRLRIDAGDIGWGITRANIYKIWIQNDITILAKKNMSCQIIMKLFRFKLLEVRYSI